MGTRKIYVIALNTFKEGIRNRIMYNLLFFAAVMIMLSYFVGQVSIGEDLKVMQDMGLSAISIFGILIAIFVGIGLVYKEVDKKTIYTIISKPIERYQFLLGKFCGLALMLFIQVCLTSLFFFAVLYVSRGIYNPELIKPVILIYVELLVITSVALFFSSFTTPFLSALFSVGFFIIGRSTDDLYDIGLKSGSFAVRTVAGLVHYFNLNHFNIIGRTVHGVFIGWNTILEVILYGVGLIVIFTALASVIFARKDFK